MAEQIAGIRFRGDLPKDAPMPPSMSPIESVLFGQKALGEMGIPVTWRRTQSAHRAIREWLMRLPLTVIGKNPS